MLRSRPSHSQQTPHSSSEGCVVCGDKVNGSRYGVPACLGCIVFFRRSVTKNSQYSCKRVGRCEIGHQSRASCRYCRQQKCIRVGMNPESIQRRDKAGPRKKGLKGKEASPDCESPSDLSTTPPSITLSFNGDQSDPLLHTLSEIQDRHYSSARNWFAAGGTHAPDPSSVDGISNLDTLMRRGWGGGMHSPHGSVPSSLHYPSPTSSSASSSNASTSSLEDISNNRVTLCRPIEDIYRNQHDNMRRARKQDINVMFHLAIVNAVEWGSQFPVFSDLPIHSKMIERELLKEYSIGFMLVNQGFNTSKQCDETRWILQHNKVYMCTDYMHGLCEQERVLPMAKTKAKLHPDFVLECITGVGNPMREMKIEQFECVLLKTLLLFECFNVYPSDRKPEIAAIRSRCLNSLAAYEAREHPQDGIERIGTLILMIANIRNSILVTCRHIHTQDIFSLMKFEPLVADIFLKKDELCPA